ncbi:type IV toxin-antitoxin system AbiEi family antitoxin domain-containing protein [Paenibacillus massiliensis]|uniref:type IV toxin-antitoxin system AbiEi family antitoxin domain-containing protein n=1 Tax=Paenibacillus massiliensis TaxID=225917 RepID=UPI000472D2AE|nr:type IV toxin-antitoxin system AbiEi family antitoxin domain-containing protein [Paenibacillus massiliensis]
MNRIQQLIDINDCQSASDYLEIADKRAMHKIACRLIYKSVEDNAFIAQITSLSVAEIEDLHSCVTFEEAANELGLTEKYLKRYIRRGLIVRDGNIPRYAIGLMKDPVFCLLMQWEYQQGRSKNLTKAEQLEDMRQRIEEFEEDYDGDFETLFGHLSDEEIDYMDNCMDLQIWKDLIVDLREEEDNAKE